MERRSFLAVGAAGAATLLTGTGAALAAPAWAAAPRAAAPGVGVDPQSLRGLSARINLPIGTALLPQDIEQSATISGGQFSVVTGENAMKWQTVEPDTPGVFDWTDADQLVAFAHANHQLIRGHTLVWHNQLPNWLVNGVAAGTITTNQLWGLLEEHIFTEVGRYRGQIWQWDVANEFFTDSSPSFLFDSASVVNGAPVPNGNFSWIQQLGPTVIPQAFKWAHEADPHALLFYNDYNIAGEDGTNAKHTAAFNFLQQQLDAHVPINGVGNQGHLDTQFGFNPEMFQQDLEHFATLGLHVAITEADVRTFVDGPTTQVPTDSLAQFAQPFEYVAMLQAVINVPQVISFTVWGFADVDSWVPGTFAGEGYADLYDVNQQPKEAYFAVQRTLQQAGAGPTRRAAPPRA